MSEGQMMQTCVVCEESFTDKAYADACHGCRGIYPAALIKANRDHFDYALRLRTGEVIRFVEARIEGAWVHLTLAEEYMQPEWLRVIYPMERGVDVRVDDIVWVADAPEGS